MLRISYPQGAANIGKYHVQHHGQQISIFHYLLPERRGENVNVSIYTWLLANTILP